MSRYFHNEGTYIYDHTNDLIMMGISKALIDRENGIKLVEFLFKKDNLDLNNLVKGKKKAGGIFVNKG
jgi:hypothetical protein